MIYHRPSHTRLAIVVGDREPTKAIVVENRQLGWVLASTKLVQTTNLYDSRASSFAKNRF